MKTTLLFVTTLLCTIVTSAQIDPFTPWTWMKGDNTTDQFGVYGTQGVANTANKPGARSFATTWRDTSGCLWLFGGNGYEINSTGYLNDLWKYNPDTDKWTWVKGDSVNEQFSVYGTQGSANIANKPGATYASVSWADANNNLWLFGGFGYTNNDFGFLNTLWKYNPATNMWTWVKGDKTIDKTGVYGTQGTPHNNNKPGARYGSNTWTDANGNLWLFGGYGLDVSGGTGVLNDLWKYNPSTNQWTWIKGDNTIDKPGVYGTKGVADAANKPGSRYVSSSWSDGSGNLWLFGGYGYAQSGSSNLNDLWKYNLSTNMWTWVSGDNLLNQAGVYGTRGMPSTANKPGARYVSSTWTDVTGALWLFGGYGYDADNLGYLNDFWKYTPSNNVWTWIKGDSTVDAFAIYGTQGMPDVSNKSGARTGSVTWTDENGNLWLFGGYGYDVNSSGVLNDLWKISSIPFILPLHLLDFSGVLNNETVHLEWQSEQETFFSHYNVQRSFDGTDFTTIGMVNGAGSNTKNDYDYYDNDLKNHPVQKVFYRLQLINKDGHYSYSKVIMFNLQQATAFSVFPNPALHSLNLSFDQVSTAKVAVNIIDMKGMTVKKQTTILPAGRASISVDVSILSSGTYIISVTNANGSMQQKFIKQ